MDKYIGGKISSLQKKKQTMINYLLLKLEEEDWHGVEDAASDIRDIEASLNTLEDVKVVFECKMEDIKMAVNF